jgi:hypothetical protein
MDKQYTLIEGLESLERIKLMMGYDMSKTLNENTFLQEQTIAGMPTSSQQQTMGLSKEREDEKKEFLVKNKIFTTPYNGITKNNSILIPVDSKISLWNSGDDRQKGLFSNWFKTGWQEYIPKEDYLKKLLPDNTLRSFTTPDGIRYQSFLERTTEKEPYYYRFIGYKDEKGNPYDQEKYVGKIPSSLQKGNWFEENWEILAQIAATLAVGIATGGQSLVVQALAQLGVDLVFTAKQLSEGDSVGALMTFILGLTPVIGRLSKFGTTAPLKFLSKYGTELSKIKDPKTLSLFYESLKGEEKILMSRLIKQTPAELKKMADEGFSNAMKKAIKDKTIKLENIPQSQRLWWRQFIVEPSAGMGAATVVAKQQQDNAIEDIKDISTNKQNKELRQSEYRKATPEEKKSIIDSGQKLYDSSEEY